MGRCDRLWTSTLIVSAGFGCCLPSCTCRSGRACWILFQVWSSLLPLRAPRLQLSFDSGEQRIKIRLDDFPDELQVQSGVSMRGDVPEAKDLSSGNSCMTLPQFLCQVVARSVRDCLKAPGHHVLEHLVT
jgi:hypothetical protein